MMKRFFLTAGAAAILMIGSAGLAQDATPTAPLEGEVPAEVPADAQVPVEGAVEGATLESVTADPGAHYGQEVTLEGLLAEFVNVRTFVLSEGAALDDDKVLVINNSPVEFDLSLVAGERVQITGVVMPSYNEGGFDQVINNFMNIIMPAQNPVDAQPPMEATPMDNTAVDASPADSTSADVTPDTTTVIEATPAEGGDPVVATPMPSVDTSVDSPAILPESVDWMPLTNAIADRYPEFTILEITSIDQVMFIPPAE